MQKYEKQVDLTHYSNESLSPLRIDSFAHQIREVAFSGCKTVLEVGVGGGLLKHFLKIFPDIKHTGIDIATDLKPDVIGSVTAMPFKDNEFELTLCCQVLEHLSFNDFDKALKEIRRVTSKRVILSLPDQRKRLGFSICLPRIQWKRYEFNFRYPQSKKKDDLHKWEIGYNGYPYNLVKSNILKAGFKIENSFRLERHAWHCFFILDVQKLPVVLKQ